MRPGRRSRRRRRAPSSATSPGGASSTCRGRAASASPPSAPAICSNVAAPGRRHPRAAARGQAAGRTARSVRARPPADRRRRARRRTIRTGSRRRTPRRRSAFAEDRAIFEGYAAAGIEGIRAGDQQSDHDAARRRAPLSRRHRPGAEPAAAGRASTVPIRCCWAPTPIRPRARPATTAIRCSSTSRSSWTAKSSGRRRSHGAFVLTTRGGDFDLHIGAGRLDRLSEP